MALQAETLKKLHGNHQGVVRCRLRTRTAVWWPGLSQQIADLLKKCPECTQDNPPHKEPLIPTPLPDYPWQKVATDLLILKGDTYIVVTDYFSRYPGIIQLKSTTTQSVTGMESQRLSLVTTVHNSVPKSSQTLPATTSLHT